MEPRSRTASVYKAIAEDHPEVAEFCQLSQAMCDAEAAFAVKVGEMLDKGCAGG